MFLRGRPCEPVVGLILIAARLTGEELQSLAAEVPLGCGPDGKLKRKQVLTYIYIYIYISI